MVDDVDLFLKKIQEVACIEERGEINQFYLLFFDNPLLTFPFLYNGTEFPNLVLHNCSEEKIVMNCIKDAKKYAEANL